MTISPITNASGAIVNFVAVKRDVTREAILQKSRDYHDDDMKERDRLLRSAPGVGLVVSFTFMGYLPELGKVGAPQISALAGLAPLNRDSGSFRGRRKVWGGRSDVRCALYMDVISAMLRNPAIKEFYDRLRASGKCFKVAVTACARKLLVILNAMVRDGSAWDERRMREFHAATY
jgi:transposase